MKIKFLGGVKHLTGSCSWLCQEETNIQFLVDCGQYQGGESLERNNFKDFEFYPGDLSFVLLTHAHLDHCGLIPKLYADGFTGKVICTSATAKLAKIILEDSARLMKDKPKALFTKSDIGLIEFSCIDERQDFKWGKDFIIEQDLSITFLRSSHILGACGISVSWKTNGGDIKSFHFSGDIGNNMDSNSYLPLLKNNQTPFSTANYILTESTYGSRVRDERYKSSENRLDYLNKALLTTLEGDGRVVIPAFSVHRTQEIFFDLWAWITSYLVSNNKRIVHNRPLKILIHSPMGMKVNQVFCEELFKPLKGKNHKDQYLGEELEAFIGNQYDPDEKNNGYSLKEYVDWLLKRDYSTKESPNKTHKENLERNFYLEGDSLDDMPAVNIEFCYRAPKNQDQWDIVVASAGMATAGPVVNYLQDIEEDPLSLILITGFQAPLSTGEALKDRALSVFDELTFDRSEAKPKVVDFSSFYSGHADQQVLLEYLFNIGSSKKINPSTVFINHGSSHDKDALEDMINSRIGVNSGERPIEQVIQIKDNSGWFNLDEGEFSSEEIQEDTLSNREILNELKKSNHLMKLMLRQQQEHFEWLKSKGHSGKNKK